MAVFNFFKLSMLLTLLSDVKLGSWTQKEAVAVGGFPPQCSRIECPTYDVVYSGDGYEIRLYNSSMWATTSPIDDISFVDGTRTGFLQLFNYIQGQNNYKQQIEMTAPVLTEIAPSDGPFCESSFLVSFYVPKKNQADPPPANGITIQKWVHTYVAVRQFGGFVTDYMVGVEAAALSSSLSGTIWADAIKKSHAGEVTTQYTVAQYNSPFEFDNRVNEIWFKFSM
ncbi:putative SOUL heme-binding protein [Helianthus annuus]|uniref:Putative SOUL heme-binding family protein n=1 Tax=Helianthus annuus TaxID=4232 RepID=A0A251TN87_HELAN|nr:heme-binding protein 2 [Helianthus annuus]KAF5787258.1 putative SOUL heme-binding protein [Helianthus annuus]